MGDQFTATAAQLPVVAADPVRTARVRTPPPVLIIGYLAFKSGYVPKLIAVLVAIDGLSYAIDTFGTVLSPGPWTDTATFTFIGELLLGLWLVIRGPRLTVTEPGAHNRPTSDPITAAR